MHEAPLVVSIEKLLICFLKDSQSFLLFRKGSAQFKWFSFVSVDEVIVIGVSSLLLSLLGCDVWRRLVETWNSQ